MALDAQMAHFVKVVVVNVCKDTEHLAENVFENADEMRRERHPHLCGENGLVFEFGRDPRKRVINVSGCWQSHRLLGCVYPQIVHAGTGVHGGTGLWGHKLGDGVVEGVE